MITPKSSAYAEAGVNINAAADAVSRMKSSIAKTHVPGVLSNAVGGFGGMFSLLGAGVSMADPVLVSSIDGVGTKLKIAFATGVHDTIGRDLVNHCINDILVQGGRPLFFLDYFATGKLQPEVVSDVVRGLADGCYAAGCALIGGETAEMPGLYNDGEYDLAGTIVGIVDRGRIIDGATVASGDLLIGLASDGLHTNGYSLARYALLTQGQIALGMYVPELNATWGEALLWPHRCYAPAVLPLLDERDLIKAMVHITGGGFVDNIPRSLPPGLGVVIRERTWSVPPIFQLIEHAGSISHDEMFRVFNMGIGFVLVVSPDHSLQVMETLKAAGESSYVIGEVVDGDGVQFLA